MKIKMLREDDFRVNGAVTLNYKEGREYSVPRRIGDELVGRRSATTKSTKNSAPESKSAASADDSKPTDKGVQTDG